MERPYLLTYDTERGQSYAWFETEEEMNEFIGYNKDKEHFNINDKMKIIQLEDL